VIHVNNDYDTLLQSAFKTELLSILNKKLKELHDKDLNLNFSDHMEVAVKKGGWSGGGIRHVKVSSGSGDAATIKVSGKVLNVTIGPGLPSTTKPSPRCVDAETLQTARRVVKVVHGNGMDNNNESSGRRGGGGGGGGYASTVISTIKSSAPQRSAPPVPDQPAPAVPVPASRHMLPGSNVSRGTLNRPAPPPSVPAPANQPVLRGPTSSSPSSASSASSTVGGAFRLPPITAGSRNGNGTLKSVAGKQRDYMKTPDAGVAGAARASIRNTKGAAPRGPPKPRMAPKPPTAIARARSLYAYQAQDADELSMKVGDLVEIITEDPSGWWQGRLNGKQGLFPGNYVQKIC